MTLMFCVLMSLQTKAQTPAVEFVERLDDGSVIVTVDGVRFRGFNTAQMRELGRQRIEFEAGQAQLAATNEEKSLLEKRLQKSQQAFVLTTEELAETKAIADKYKKMYETEQSLRQAAEKLPAKKSALNKLLDHPLTKLVVVIAAGTVAAKARK
jgi:ABC-type uncharacterized transport system permease subunit